MFFAKLTVQCHFAGHTRILLSRLQAASAVCLEPLAFSGAIFRCRFSRWPLLFWHNPQSFCMPAYCTYASMRLSVARSGVLPALPVQWSAAQASDGAITHAP